MSHNNPGRFSRRFPSSLVHAKAAKPSAVRAVAPQAGRARGRGQANTRLPFMPPEVFHEPQPDATGYKFIVQGPGPGYRHVVTPDEIRARLSLLPEALVRPLQVVQISGMTRKKRSMPLYGMQWGSAIYLYPIEVDLVETYDSPPKPAQLIEARMYGGRWIPDGDRWRLVWTEEAIKDFYLNNILIHELGHIVDGRNTRTIDRERYAEWFALHYGYRPTRGRASREVVRRHG